MSTLEEHLAAALAHLHLEPDPELADTPRRVAEFARSFCAAGPSPEVSRCDTTHTDPVAVRDIPFYALCVHHLLPFFGTVSVAYLPDRGLAGLGSIPQVVQWHARRLTLQERLVAGVADTLVEALAPRALRVTSQARHLCVEMRGPTVPIQARVTASRGLPSRELEELLRA